ncbi:hypothetical protein TNIN_181301 [Trichonephila inaurata madagascariensis]|uniref:Uncharacterized protein n=1 Tax=Trichonephila inaurata madagascariensis TaxID=2747483 RepID=A0A8X6XWJ4_9ARAC|nr:hypothetical protein TNIN_181301 [Trichonephila inaurata madagascariensis]
MEAKRRLLLILRRTPFLIVPSGKNRLRDFQSDSTEREYPTAKAKLNELVESCQQRVVIATPSSLQSINRSSHPAAPLALRRLVAKLLTNQRKSSPDIF